MLQYKYIVKISTHFMQEHEKCSLILELQDGKSVYVTLFVYCMYITVDYCICLTILVRKLQQIVFKTHTHTYMFVYVMLYYGIHTLTRPRNFSVYNIKLKIQIVCTLYVYLIKFLKTDV